VLSDFFVVLVGNPVFTAPVSFQLKVLANERNGKTHLFIKEHENIKI
jgi:hypothetical protein